MNAKVRLLDEIAAVVGAYRPLLEDKIERFLDTPQTGAKTTGFCRGSSVALLNLLNVAFPEINWRLTGGLGVESTPYEGANEFYDLANFPGGMLDKNGNWQGHFWVEGKATDGVELIVDATADQFGYPDVVVTEQDDHRYRRNVREVLGFNDLVTSIENNWGLSLFWDWSLSREHENCPNERPILLSGF